MAKFWKDELPRYAQILITLQSQLTIIRQGPVGGNTSYPILFVGNKAGEQLPLAPFSLYI
jgi:hypothetical protein